MRKKKIAGKGIAAAVSCAMLATSIPFGTYAADPAPNDLPQPKFYFDMESIEGNKIVNQVTGSAYDVGGDAAESISSIGQYGNALRFNGSHYVDLGTEFQLQNAYTMTGWIRQDAGATDGQAVFSRAWSGDVKDQLAMMLKGGQVYHAFSVGDGNSNFKEFFTNAAIKEDKWEHVALTRDGSQIKVYVGGEEIYSGTDFSADDFSRADKHMYIGMDCNGSGNLYKQHAFKGAMDELRLYDTALTAEQIQELAYAEAAYEITSAANGEIVITLSREEVPDQDAFSVEFTVDGKKVETEITGYQYQADGKQAIISFKPFENYQNTEKEVKIAVTYQGFEKEITFVLPAGDNESPAAKELVTENMSEKLGAEPHVKGMLKAQYTYEDPDQDAEGETKYQWYISDTADGEYEKISGICTQTVILLDDYEGKYLKCEITPVDVHGNRGEAVMTPATTAPVQATEGNPLTDWMHEAGFGLSHHFLSNYFNLPAVYTSPEEMWDRKAMTWDEFVGKFDAEAYAEQVNAIGAKYVIITLGQNSGSYCAPNDVYDKYMREAGLLKAGEKNPKTTGYENDLPMKMANALEKYGIKVMLYLPSNPPHSACWDETGTPNGYGYYTDYLVTKEVFHYTPGADGNPSQESRKRLAEMVEWWSLHYGDKIAGWWFDGFYHTGQGSQMDMSLEYNVSTLANAAKAGNPYSIVTFNQGMGDGRYKKITEYTDYTAGECTGLDGYPIDGRWSVDSTDCQNFMFGPLGSRNSWQNGWGCSGINHQDVQKEVVDFVDGALQREHAIALDVRVNVHGQIDPAQYEQLEAVAALWENEDTKPVSKKTLEYFLNKAKEHVANGDIDGCVDSIQKLFEDAIAEGEAIMAKEDATKEEVTVATTKLIQAIHALEMLEGDKTDLEMALELANSLDLAKYVEKGQAEFLATKKTAEEVLANGDAMQEEVDAAWNALVETISQLRLKADKSALEELLESVKGLNLEQYTEKSVAVFKSALAKAQEVMADESLSEDEQKTVDDAVKALADAKAGLKLKDGGHTEKPDGDNGSNTQKPVKDKIAPKTGDAGTMAMAMMAMLLAGGTIVTLKKRKEE